MRPGRWAWWLRRVGRACLLFVIVAAIAGSAMRGATLRIVDLLLVIASVIAAHYWARFDENRRLSA